MLSEASAQPGEVLPQSTREPLVSVIIPTFNCSRLLVEAIDSALAQTYARVEVVVVDDGSTDDTADVVQRRFGDRVTYIRQANAGTPAARNTGIRQSSGDLIALLDQDDLWAPNKLERQVPYFAEDSRVGLVAAGGNVMDLASGRTTSTFLPRPSLDVHDLLAWCEIACATAVFRRKALDEVGMLDETLPGADDWDLWIRIADHYRVVGCREELATLREHGNNQGKRLDRMYRMVGRVLDKHDGRLHPNGCDDCRRAIRQARKTLRRDYYMKACNQARAAACDGRYVRALGLRLRALWRDPSMIARLPYRAAQRVISF